MLLTVLILLVTRPTPDQHDGCQLLLIPKDNGPWIDCSREGTHLEISCDDMAGAAIGLDVLLTKSHYSPTVEKLSVSLQKSTTETGSSNLSCITEETKKDLQRHFEHCIQRGLTSVRLAVQSISQVEGIFPSNMNAVDLEIALLENPMKGELNDWVSSFSSVCVKSLTLDAFHLDGTVDLEDLLCVLCQNATILHIKTKLVIEYGRVSAERALELIQKDLPYELEVYFMVVHGIQMLSTLKGLLTSKCIFQCTLKVEPGFQDSLTEDACREVLEMEEVSDCLSASPSMCDLFTSIFRRVTVCSNTLYWPDCQTLEDVNYITDTLFPLLDEKCKSYKSDYKLRICMWNAEVHGKMAEIAQNRLIPYEDVSDEDDSDEDEADEDVSDENDSDEDEADEDEAAEEESDEDTADENKAAEEESDEDNADENKAAEEESDEDEADEDEADENDDDLRYLTFFFNHDQLINDVFARRQIKADMGSR